MIEAFVTNLGRYNEGRLDGEDDKSLRANLARSETLADKRHRIVFLF